MKRLATAVAALLVSAQTHAACYIAGNFDGIIASGIDDFEIAEDGFGDRTFTLLITENHAAVSPTDLECQTAATNLIICVGASGTSAVLETWHIDIDTATVVYTQTRGGSSIPEFNGSKLFTGNLIRPCD